MNKQPKSSTSFFQTNISNDYAEYAQNDDMRETGLFVASGTHIKYNQDVANFERSDIHGSSTQYFNQSFNSSLPFAVQCLSSPIDSKKNSSAINSDFDFQLDIHSEDRKTFKETLMEQSTYIHPECFDETDLSETKKRNNNIEDLNSTQIFSSMISLSSESNAKASTSLMHLNESLQNHLHLDKMKKINNEDRNQIFFVLPSDKCKANELICAIDEEKTHFNNFQQTESDALYDERKKWKIETNCKEKQNIELKLSSSSCSFSPYGSTNSSTKAEVSQSCLDETENPQLNSTAARPSELDLIEAAVHMRLHTTAQNHFCQDSIGKVGGAARAMLIQSERESMLERWMVEDKKWKRSHETSEMHSYSNCFTDTTKVNKIQQTAFLDGPMQKKRREIIRKQIKEAKQFERVFGEWVRKEWVSNEEERKMWDAAEFKERFEVPGDIDAGTDECTDEDCSKDAHPSVRRALTLEEMKTKLKTSDLNAMTETEKDDYLNQIARESMKEKKACTVASFLVLPHSSRQSRKRDEKAQIQALSLKSEQRQLDLSTVIAPQGSCNETSTPMHHIELREAAKTDTLQNISQKLLHFPSMFESNRNSTDYSSQLHSKLYSPVSLSEPFCIKKQRLREIPKAGNDKNLGRFEPRLHKESNSSATEKRISSSQHSLHTSFPQLHMNSLLHNTFEKEPYFCDSACTTFSQLYFIQEEESALPSFPSWVLSQPSAGVGIVFDVNKTVADAEEFLPRHSEVLNNGKTAKKMRRKGMDPNAFLQKTRDLMAEVLIRPNLVVPFCKITKTKEKKKAKGKIHNLYSLNLSCLQGRLM